MSFLEELLSDFRKGAKIRCSDWANPRGYIQCVNGNIMSEYNRVCALSEADILSDKWEFYKEPEPDWDYIIKDKCLCWFWDNNFNWAVCGTLGKIEKCAACKFIMFDDSGNRSPYVNCRPVRKDEVNFYEDLKNECTGD